MSASEMSMADVDDVLPGEKENLLDDKNENNEIEDDVLHITCDGIDEFEKILKDENSPKTMRSENYSDQKKENEKINVKSKPQKPSSYTRNMAKKNKKKKTKNAQRPSMPPTCMASWDGIDELEILKDENRPKTMRLDNYSDQKQENEKINVKSKPPKPSPYTRNMAKKKNKKKKKKNAQRSSMPPTCMASCAATPFVHTPDSGQCSALTTVQTIWLNPANQQAQPQWMPQGTATNKYSGAPPQHELRSPITQQTSNNQEQFIMQGNAFDPNKYSVPPAPIPAQQPPQSQATMQSPYGQPQQMNMKEYCPSMQTSPSLGSQVTDKIYADPDYHPCPGKLINVAETQWQHSFHWLLDLFGVRCLANIDGECHAPNCNHATSDTGDVTRNLLLLDADSLLITYGLLRRHRLLFIKFAECFAYAFSGLYLLEDLLHLLADCRLYRAHSSHIVGLAFELLKNHNLEFVATRCIMEYLWSTSRVHEFKEMNIKILQIIVSTNWHEYSDQLSCLFKTGFSVPPEILSTIISSTNGRPDLTLRATELLNGYMQFVSVAKNTELQAANYGDNKAGPISYADICTSPCYTHSKDNIN